ncbi:MAG: methyl-accepting chemotaxis protein [Oscillospiraceae bacterium]
MNKKKKAKILIKLAMGIILPVLLILGSTGALIITNAKSSLTGLSNDVLKEQSLTAAAYVDAFFSTYIDKAEANAQSQQIQSLLKDVDKATQFPQSEQYPAAFESLKNITNGDADNILGTWICDIESGQVTKSDGFTTEPGWDPTIREWYNVTKTGSSLVTEPFVDANTKQLILSSSAPVFDGNSKDIIGISGINIKLDRIAEVLSQKKIGESGSLVLISSNGTVIYSPYKDDIQKNISELNFSKNVLDMVAEKTEGNIEYTVFGKDQFGYMANVGDTGWTILTGIPSSEFNAPFTNMKIIIYIVYGLGLVIMMALIILISGSLVRPIKSLKKVAEDLANGNLDVSMDINSNDEIGDVAHAFDKTIDRLKEYVSYINEVSDVLGEISDGNLMFDLKCEYVGEFSKIKSALLNFQTTMISIMENIKETSSDVAQGSEQVSDASQSLSQSTTEQASAIEELSATIMNISNEVKNNAENASEASEMIGSVTTQIVQSNDEMAQMIKAMSDISEASSQIGKIIKTIEDIAFQTNILALNAAVEAARAGSAGKGFAVVADEVRNLASKSAEAAQNTTVLIENAVKAVENGTNMAATTASSLSKAVEGSASIAQVAQKINEASNAQATSIVQVTQGIEQISAVIQTNSAASEESAATSEELSGHAATLKKLVNKFRIK